MEYREQFHKCLSEVCGGRKGDLIPLSDYGPGLKLRERDKHAWG